MLPERLGLSPQLPPGWGYLKLRNVRWHRVTADIAITRDGAGYAISVEPHGGVLPLDVTFALAPGAELSLRDSSGRPLAPKGDITRGAQTSGFRMVSTPTTFAVKFQPGIQMAPINDPLQLGDESSRLRIIDARLEGRVYTATVEGRRGRSYKVRLSAPFAIGTIKGAVIDQWQGATNPYLAPNRILQVDMPAAAPAAPAPRSDWVTREIVMTIGERLK